MMSRKKSVDKDQMLPVQSQLLLFRTEDGRTSIKVRLQEESVWLNQSAAAELFQSSKQNISLHLRNIFHEGELAENRVVKEYLTTAADGKHRAPRPIQINFSGDCRCNPGGFPPAFHLDGRKVSIGRL